MLKMPVIRQYAFRHVATKLDHMNVDVGRVLSRNGIQDWRQVDEHTMIPVVHFMKALEAGARATGEETFAMMVAEDVGVEDFGDYGKAILSGMTVHEALNNMCLFVTSQAPTIEFWLSRRDNGVLICRKQLVAHPDLVKALTHVERYAMLLMLNIIRAGAGPEWTPTWVSLSTEKDDLFGQWSEFGEPSVEFCAPFSAIFVPDEVLILPLRGQKEAVPKAFSVAKRNLTRDMSDQEFVHDVRMLMDALLQQKSAKLSTLSNVTSMSQRTIQRRLAEGGQTFNSLLDQVRYQRAVIILDQEGASVAEAGELLGYEHPQHFIRAFRRWTGVTPGKYRKIRSKRG